MTTTQEGTDPVNANMEVMLSLSELRGQLTTFLSVVGRHDTEIARISTEVRAVDNRVTTIEATRKATPAWWVWLPAVCSVLAIGFVVLDRLNTK